MIREATAKDFDELGETWLRSSIVAHSFISEDHWRSNLTVVNNQYLPNSKTFLYQDEKIRGFCSVLNDNFIGACFVDIDSQGIGIGTKLINHVQSIFNSLELHVYKENENAHKFYIKCGFQDVEENIAEDGHIEILMLWTKHTKGI